MRWAKASPRWNRRTISLEEVHLTADYIPNTMPSKIVPSSDRHAGSYIPVRRAMLHTASRLSNRLTRYFFQSLWRSSRHIGKSAADPLQSMQQMSHQLPFERTNKISMCHDPVHFDYSQDCRPRSCSTTVAASIRPMTRSEFMRSTSAESSRWRASHKSRICSVGLTFVAK